MKSGGDGRSISIIEEPDEGKKKAYVFRFGYTRAPSLVDRSAYGFSCVPGRDTLEFDPGLVLIRNRRETESQGDGIARRKLQADGFAAVLPAC
jgi:hypothetical protein